MWIIHIERVQLAKAFLMDSFISIFRFLVPKSGLAHGLMASHGGTTCDFK